MLRNIRKLAGDSLIYGLSGIITRFLSVFLIPIYTRIFSPADYGVINLVNTMFVLIGLLVVLGLDNSATFWYWNKEEESERRTTFSSWFWTQILFSVIIVVVTFFLAPTLSGIVFNETTFGDLFLLAALNLPFSAFTLVFSTWLRIKRNAIGSVAFSSLNSIITIGLSIYLVVYLRVGLKGVFLSQLIANAISAVVVIFAMPANLSFGHYSLRRLGQMLKYSGPLIPALIAYWILNSAGSYFINHYATKSDVGLYQIGSSCAAICGLLFWAFLQAWSPFAMSIQKQSDAPKIYSFIFDIYCALGGTLVLFVFLFAPEILALLTTKEYVNAAMVAGILSFNIYIANVAQITCIGCSIVKNNMPYAVGVFLGSGASVLFYFLLIPLFGKEGAAVSTLIGSSILVSYVTYRAQKLYFVPYNIKKNCLLILIMTALIILSRFLNDINLIMLLSAKVILLSLFLFYLILSNRRLVSYVIKKIRPQLLPIDKE